LALDLQLSKAVYLSFNLITAGSKRPAASKPANEKNLLADCAVLIINSLQFAVFTLMLLLMMMISKPQKCWFYFSPRNGSLKSIQSSILLFSLRRWMAIEVSE